jgi:RNA polymerase sigma factor (sigma-70 family)
LNVDPGVRLTSILKRVTWYLKKTIADNQLREDMAQEVLARLAEVESEQGCPLQPDRDWPLALCLVRRIVADHTRRLRKQSLSCLGDNAKWVTDAKTDGPAQQIDMRAILSRARNGLANLREIERAVLEARFGLNNTPKRSRRSIAVAYNLATESVHRIEQRALEKLRSEIACEVY